MRDVECGRLLQQELKEDLDSWGCGYGDSVPFVQKVVKETQGCGPVAAVRTNTGTIATYGRNWVATAPPPYAHSAELRCLSSDPNINRAKSCRAAKTRLRRRAQHTHASGGRNYVAAVPPPYAHSAELCLLSHGLSIHRVTPRRAA